VRIRFKPRYYHLVILVLASLTIKRLTPATYIHTCIHTYMHTYILTYIHAYILEKWTQSLATLSTSVLHSLTYISPGTSPAARDTGLQRADTARGRAMPQRHNFLKSE
jgi:hypothetical protein